MNDLSLFSQPDLLREAMLEAASQAAGAAIACAGAGLNIEQKPDKSQVTNGDVAAQLSVLRRMNAFAKTNPRYADLKFLCEESREAMEHAMAEIQEPERGEILGRIRSVNEWSADRSGHYLVIDPIDGTKNYIGCYGGFRNQDGQRERVEPEELKNPWTVSIALQEDGKNVAAALYEAVPGESGGQAGLKGKHYWAQWGLGAYCIENGAAQKLECRPFDPVPKSARSYVSRFASDVDRNVSVMRDNIADQCRYYSQVLDTKCVSASMLHVASGRNSFRYPALAVAHGGAAPWDWAAAALVLEEAGVPLAVVPVKCETLPGLPLCAVIAARSKKLMDAMMTTYEANLPPHYRKGEAEVDANRHGELSELRPRPSRDWIQRSEPDNTDPSFRSRC